MLAFQWEKRGMERPYVLEPRPSEILLTDLSNLALLGRALKGLKVNY